MGAAAAAASTGSVCVGDVVEARDTVGRWYVADVLDVKAGEAFVHYIGWNDKWNARVSVDVQIAPLGTHTDGQPYGLGRARDAVERDDLDALRALVTRETVNRQHELLGGGPTTLLECAVSNHNTDAARVLLQLGADPNLGNSHGRTPLHYACGHGANEAMVLSLLQHGADKDATDSDGKMPLDWCYSTEAKARFESAVRRFTQYVCGVARAVDAYVYPHDVVDQFVLEYVFGANTVNDSKAALAEARRSDDGAEEEEEEEEE